MNLVVVPLEDLNIFVRHGQFFVVRSRGLHEYKPKKDDSTPAPIPC